jgi:outer membrane protein
MFPMLFRKLSAALVVAMAAVPALAADLPTSKGPAAAPVAYEAPSPWMIRVRALAVIPDAKLDINGVAGVNGKINTSYVPELDISYFFTKNIAAELILGVTPHKVTGNAGAINGLPIGKTLLLPPTLTLQYHFTDFGAFKPYVGAGLNYTFFLDQNPGNTTVGGLTVTRLNVKSAPGFALQAGFDYMLNANWGLNFDVKKIWLRPDYTATVTPLGAIAGKLRIDPWIIGVGVTYRFGGPAGAVVARY